jgi:hypothetical protein
MSYVLEGPEWGSGPITWSFAALNYAVDAANSNHESGALPETTAAFLVASASNGGRDGDSEPPAACAPGRLARRLCRPAQLARR